MKAILCKELGPPQSLVYEEIPDLQPGPGQVVIDVKAAGVNFPDVLIIEGKYQFKPELPFSPGGEVAGVVKEVGAGVAAVKPGDRVIASSTWGGFAEELVVEYNLALQRELGRWGSSTHPPPCRARATRSPPRAPAPGRP